MSENQIPPTWEYCVLSDLGDISSGGTPSTKNPELWGDDIPWISPSDLTGYTAKYIARGAKSLSKKGLLKSSAKLMPAGSVHFSSRAPIGYVAISSQSLCTNQGFKSLAPADGVFNEYVYFHLKSIKGLANSLATGTTFKELSGKAFAKLPIPLPPLAEQRRIVAKIEELFSELDAGEESLRRARRQLGVYRQSLLKQAFEGKLTERWRKQNPRLLEDPEPLTALIEARSKRAKFRTEQQHEIKSWSYRCLDELTEFVTSGSRGWADYYSESGSLFIRAQNLNRDYLNLDDIAFVQPPESAEGRRTMVKFGDLLITITGANTTKAGWVHLPLDDAYVSQHVALCRPVSDTLSPFLYRYIISEAGGRKRLTADAYGAGKPGLNLDHVRSLVIPIPTLPEQQEIVRLLDEQFTVIEQNEREIDAALKRSAALRQSILKKAFTGQLVPQAPTDEPASTLLERIRKEREGSSSSKQPKKKVTPKRP